VVGLYVDVEGLKLFTWQVWVPPKLAQICAFSMLIFIGITAVTSTLIGIFTLSTNWTGIKCAECAV
jgi:hypothetical protein